MASELSFLSISKLSSSHLLLITWSSKFSHHSFPLLQSLKIPLTTTSNTLHGKELFLTTRSLCLICKRRKKQKKESPLLLTTWSLKSFYYILPDSHCHKKFITSSPLHWSLKLFSSPHLLNHVLIAKWTAARSASQIHHIPLFTHCLLYMLFPKMPNQYKFTLEMASCNVCQNIWKLSTFNSSLKAEVVHWTSDTKAYRQEIQCCTWKCLPFCILRHIRHWIRDLLCEWTIMSPIHYIHAHVWVHILPTYPNYNNI
jgi:hypothetical protein